MTLGQNENSREEQLRRVNYDDTEIKNGSRSSRFCFTRLAQNLEVVHYSHVRKLAVESTWSVLAVSVT